MTKTKDFSAAERARIGRNAGIIGIGVNVLLFAVKLTTGILSGSVSILADAVNNLTDAGSSILILIGYVISSKPADREHPYGHARMEYLCGLFISILVTVLGIELFKSSVENILHPAISGSYSIVSLLLMGAAVAAKVFLALFYRTVGHKINSQSLRASAADSIGDVCATLAVILGMLLTPVIGPASDGIFGCLIAVYIFVMGVKLIIDSSSTLLGTAPDIELIKKIVAKIKSYNGVLGIHDLVIHSYGADQYFVSVHVEMDAERNILECHDIIDNIESDFRKDMGMQLVIHLDPIAVRNEQLNELKNAVREVIDEISGEFSSPISFHDFRAVFGVTHTNLIFDLALPHEFPLSNEELVDMLRADLQKKLGEEYRTVITIDRDYTTKRYENT
ncbi:MAG: cation diffusion facilitator family transporter [Eubacteriales bacterium]